MLAPSSSFAHAVGSLRDWAMGRGRKRKVGAREKNGRPQRKRKQELVDEKVRIARAMPHRRELKSNDRVSELAESALGRLRLDRVAASRRRDFASLRDAPGLTAREHAAGELFGRTVNRYRSVIEGPRAVRSLTLATSYEWAGDEEESSAAERFDCPTASGDPIEKMVHIAGRLLPVREWPCQQAGGTCGCAERRRRYMRVYEAVAQAGRRALMAVIAVAVRGEELPPSEIVYLRAGLDAAADEYGLTDDGT